MVINEKLNNVVPYLVCVCLFIPVTPLVAADVRAEGGGRRIDRFGGYVPLPGSNKSGFFRVERIGDRYYLMTPANHAFVSLAVDTANFSDRWGGYCPTLESYPNPYGNKAKYNNDGKAWQAAIKSHLAHWGFNGLGCWCQQGVPELTENVRCLHISEVAFKQGVAAVVPKFPDVFDPNFAKAADQQAKSLAAYADNPFRIGAFPDNEIRWVGADYWGKKGGRPTLPDAFIGLSADAPGKQYWAGQFLTGKYTTIEKLNAAYGTAFTGFTGENDTVINATELPNDPDHPAILEDKKGFVEAIADTYYKVVTAAMRKYDPNHLIFSDRWALWTTGFHKNFPEHQAYNERIWKKGGQYCDIIAINSYMDNGALEAEHKLYSRVFAQSRKPFMITEWATLADDTQFSRHPEWRRYQHQKGNFYFDQMKVFCDFAFPESDGKLVHPFLGAQWFQYYDEPSLGRTDGEKANFGLLNVKGEPYQTTLDVMRTFNVQMYDYLVNGTRLKLRDAPEPKAPVPVPGSVSKTGELDINKMGRESALPQFTWSGPKEAESFTVLYSPEKCFPLGQTVRVDGIKGTSYTPKRPLAAGLWYWCVRAVDTNGLGGKYSDPCAFYVKDAGTGRRAPIYLNLADLSGWRHVSLEDGGWDGVAWAFYDKKGGRSSARVQFTVNSLNKLTDEVNERKSKIIWRYVGPAIRAQSANRLSFGMQTSRAVDSAGEMTVASKYISVRIADEGGKVILDDRIDPDGSLPPEKWNKLSFELTTPHDGEMASIAFYVDTAAKNVPWDQRLVIWLAKLRFATGTVRR